MGERRLGDVKEKIIDGDGVFDNGKILGDEVDGYDYPYSDMCCKKCDGNLFIFQFNEDEMMIKLICSGCGEEIELTLCIGCNDKTGGNN